MANCGLENMAERAAAAKAAWKEYIDLGMVRYATRSAQRKVLKVPAIALCGMGRAGKDTAALYLSENFTHVRFAQSSSQMLLPMVAHMAGEIQSRVFAERHQNREFWIAACNALRADDPTFALRLCLGANDFVVGPRGLEEFRAGVRDGVVELNVWVDNERVPADKTVEFAREDCDLVVDNHTSLERYYERLQRLGRVLYARAYR